MLLIPAWFSIILPSHPQDLPLIRKLHLVSILVRGKYSVFPFQVPPTVTPFHSNYLWVFVAHLYVLQWQSKLILKIISYEMYFRKLGHFIYFYFFSVDLLSAFPSIYHVLRSGVRHLHAQNLFPVPNEQFQSKKVKMENYIRLLLRM